ncbi:MAG: dipeptidase PepE [Bacteroidota bacterium]|nr:dipeptidase PepE [Bacteroidota bacterium]
MSLKKILAFSSSRDGNTGYLETAVESIKNFLGEKILQIAFIPFASVEKDYADYIFNVRTALQSLGHTINLVDHHNAKKIIEQSDVIMVGGGNSFKLLHDIYVAEILDVIRDKVNAAAPYIGWSAGSNILCPAISTTNDMPIIQPKSFNALGLFPFQINPHYFNQKPDGHNGETRDQRLTEFMKMNPGVSVIGLPEGTALHLEKNKLKFTGECSGILFLAKESNIIRKETMPGEDLSFLL